MFQASKVSVSDAHALEGNNDNGDSSDNAMFQKSFNRDSQTRHLNFVLKTPRRDIVMKRNVI